MNIRTRVLVLQNGVHSNLFLICFNAMLNCSKLNQSKKLQEQLKLER